MLEFSVTIRYKQQADEPRISRYLRHAREQTPVEIDGATCRVVGYEINSGLPYQHGNCAVFKFVELRTT